MKLNRAFLNKNLRAHERIENRFEHIPRVFLKFHEPPMVVDIRVTEFFEFGDEVEVTFGEEKTFAWI